MNLKIDVILYGVEPGNSIKVFRNEDTIGYCFINSGNSAVDINNMVLLPGSVWKTLEPGYTDQTIYRLKFNQSNLFDSACPTAYSTLTCIIYSKVK